MTTLHKVYAISLHCSPVVSHPQKSSLLASSHSCEGHKFLSELLPWSFRLPLSSKNKGVPHHRNSYRANLHTKCIALPSSSPNNILSYQHYRDRFPTLETLRCHNTKALLTLFWPRWLNLISPCALFGISIQTPNVVSILFQVSQPWRPKYLTHLQTDSEL